MKFLILENYFRMKVFQRKSLFNWACVEEFVKIFMSCSMPSASQKHAFTKLLIYLSTFYLNMCTHQFRANAFKKYFNAWAMQLSKETKVSRYSFDGQDKPHLMNLYPLLKSPFRTKLHRDIIGFLNKLSQHWKCEFIFFSDEWNYPQESSQFLLKVHVDDVF